MISIDNYKQHLHLQYFIILVVIGDIVLYLDTNWHECDTYASLYLCFLTL